MKALSVRQPDAWLLVNGWKDVENRGKRTSFRGVVAVHASAKRPTTDDMEYLAACCDALGIPCPEYNELALGAIVGLIEIVDCVTESESDWFDGPVGWVIGKYLPLENPITPCKGQLGLFDLPIEIESQIEAQLE